MKRIFNGLLILGLFGMQQLDAASLIEANAFAYTGQSLNHTTGLIVLGGYRAYSPNSGTFLKQDAYSAFQGQGTFDGFNYAAGNPVIFSDPSGHLSSSTWNKILIGGLVIAGIFIIWLNIRLHRAEYHRQVAEFSLYSRPRRTTRRITPNQTPSLRTHRRQPTLATIHESNKEQNAEKLPTFGDDKQIGSPESVYRKAIPDTSPDNYQGELMQVHPEAAAEAAEAAEALVQAVLGAASL